MNFDKRYCQNRVKKRKKVIEPPPPKGNDTSMEDERKYKINRFVKDVNKFMENRRQVSDQKEVPVSIGSPLKKPQKRTKNTNLVGRRGLFQNGIQTKFYNRGIYGKELTARLDEDLQQIISLVNKENNQEVHNSTQVHVPRVDDVPKLVDQPLPSSRASSDCLSHSTPCVEVDSGNLFTTKDKSPSMLDKLDVKLYPEFTRIVTLSSIESKTMQFRNKSYVAALKRKLLEIHKQERMEDNQELSCPSDVQKSSVGTSPLRSCSPQSGQPNTQYTSDIEQGFEFIHFRPEPFKSTSEFLEETIGPGSSSKRSEKSPESQAFCSQTSPIITRHVIPHQEQMLSRRFAHHEPLPAVSSIPPASNLMMPFDGGGDQPYTHSISHLFLPPQEESPVFQYFPRRMY